MTAIKGREVKDSNSPNAKLADELETSHREEPNRVDSIFSSSDGSYESESSDFEKDAQEGELNNELPTRNNRRYPRRERTMRHFEDQIPWSSLYI